MDVRNCIVYMKEKIKQDFWFDWASGFFKLLQNIKYVYSLDNDFQLSKKSKHC